MKTAVSGWVSDAVLIAAVSVGGYGLAFLFEIGYASHFGYPSYVISPTPATIASSLVFVFASVASLPALAATLLHSRDLNERLLVGMTVAVLALVGAGVLLIPERWHYALWGYAAFMLFSLWVLERVRMRRRARFGPSTRWTPRLRTYLIVLCSMGAMSSAGIALALGAAIARFQGSFFFLESKADFAVVRMYGELVVAAKVDRSANRFTGEYFVGKFGTDEMRIHLKRQRVPPMKPFGTSQQGE